MTDSAWSGFCPSRCARDPPNPPRWRCLAAALGLATARRVQVGSWRGFPFKGDLELSGRERPGGQALMACLAESAERGAQRRVAGERPRPRPRPPDSRAGPRAAPGHLRRRQPCERPRAAARERGGLMELKKDNPSVAIDMLLIVQSEKRRAAHGPDLADGQDEPGAPQPRAGGNARPPRTRHPGPDPRPQRPPGSLAFPTKPGKAGSVPTLPACTPGIHSHSGVP